MKKDGDIQKKRPVSSETMRDSLRLLVGLEKCAGAR